MQARTCWRNAWGVLALLLMVGALSCSRIPDEAFGTWEEAEAVLASAPAPERATLGGVERMGDIRCSLPSGCARARVAREFTIVDARTVGDLCEVVEATVVDWTASGFLKDETATAGEGDCAVYGSADGHDVNVFTAESDSQGRFVPSVMVTVWVRRP